MKPRPENLEPSQIAGFLAGDGRLYCSRECAERAGFKDAAPVDAAEYDAVAERAEERGDVVCPQCGGEYPLPPGDEEKP